MHHLLRMEAINLDATILDTNDLSTRRGGSYMLLQAVRDVEREFSGQLKAISTGASVGLFAIEGQDRPDEFEHRVREFVTQHPLYMHATFVVTAVSYDSGFKLAHERAIAAGRWQQMQSLSVSSAWAVPPDLDAENVLAVGAIEAVCEIDEVRPATVRDYMPGQTKTAFGTSVWRRRFDVHGGRALRQTFYERELVGHGVDANYTFTADLETLARLPPCPPDADPGIPSTLDNKIALFYADGNGFGRIQAACDCPDKLQKWDTHLKAERREFLANLLAFVSTQEPWLTGDRKLRLETLLWGGDELMFVVPAWCGLELADRFFSAMASLRDPNGDPNKPLTHAAGLVFAHRSAPIGRLQSLAWHLAEKGKADDKQKNLDTLTWVVLESFDHAGADLDGYLASRYPIAAVRPTWARLQLTPPLLTALRNQMPALRNMLPRSQIVRAVERLVDGRQSSDRLLRRSYHAIGTADESDAFASLWLALTDHQWSGLPATEASTLEVDLAAWTVMLELWDYAVAGADL